MTNWLLVLAGILIVAKHKQISRMFRAVSKWHYLILATLALWLVLFATFAGTTLWLLHAHGIKGLIGPAIFIFGYTAWRRIFKGHWPGELH